MQAPVAFTKTRWLVLVGAVIALPGCGENGGPLISLKQPSKSSTISVSDDDRFVVMVNPEDDSISIFSTSNNRLTAKVKTGDEPSAVVIHPNGTTAFVANRADATVVKVTGIDSASPVVSPPLEVGSEPVGLALSPTGASLFVAEWAEGRVSVVNTVKMGIRAALESPASPRALAVTNDGDLDDGDETLIVPEFFGEALEGGEGTDTGRVGRVRLFALSDLRETGLISLAPINSGFQPVATAPPIFTSPNQLTAVAVLDGRAFIASISASPAAPSVFNGNVFPVVYVADLRTGAEDRSGAGSANLARKVFDAAPSGPRLALGDIVDLDFEGGSNVAYVLSRGADAVQRVAFDASGVSVGATGRLQIDVGPGAPQGPGACLTPTGIVVAHSLPRAYVNCWVSRRLGVVDLTTQALTEFAQASDPPTGEEIAINKGRRFFFTARGRWAREGFSSCASCHPDGLTDNMTWIFAAGPRQTTSLDGTYSHGPGPQKERILNWTAIFEELHDFERNTRGTSGGLGAITISPTGACGTMALEVQDPATPALPGGLAQPLKELQDRPENCTRDWDDVDAWVRTIRPPRALRSLDPFAVERGRAVFEKGSCASCHGGSGWTVSRRFWTPTTPVNAALAATPFTPPSLWPAEWNRHTLQIAAQPAIADSTGAPVGPPQVACVLRNVGTFGVPGNATATSALEKKPDGTRAQGAGGFNVPSLYGLSVGAPYLHHGQGRSLDELIEDPRWASHVKAASPSFAPSSSERRDLISFLLSIDAQASEEALVSGQDGCPARFP